MFVDKSRLVWSKFWNIVSIWIRVYKWTGTYPFKGVIFTLGLEFWSTTLDSEDFELCHHCSPILRGPFAVPTDSHLDQDIRHSSKTISQRSVPSSPSDSQITVDELLIRKKHHIGSLLPRNEAVRGRGGRNTKCFIMHEQIWLFGPGYKYFSS